MKRFAAGNIIIWSGIGSTPMNITENKLYKVQFVHEMYSICISNDINEYLYNLSGFVDIEYWLDSNHSIKRGSSVNIIENEFSYIVMDFCIEGGRNSGNLLLDIKKSH